MKILFRCKCGWSCYSPEQVKYHKGGSCKEMKRLVGVMQARERSGVQEHDGLNVGQFKIVREITH